MVGEEMFVIGHIIDKNDMDKMPNTHTSTVPRNVQQEKYPVVLAGLQKVRDPVYYIPGTF